MSNRLPGYYWVMSERDSKPEIWEWLERGIWSITGFELDIVEDPAIIMTGPLPVPPRPGEA